MTRHLIHIGFPKAGSTFLQKWFERHPELRYEPGGLGGFYSVYEMARPNPNDYKYYVTSFEGLSTPHESAGGIRLDFGGVEPYRPRETKKDQERVCSILRSFYPGSCVLIITRGFKGMIFSAYSQYLRMGGRSDLSQMCRDFGELMQDDARHFYDYDYLTRLYSETFGEDNVIVMPYELLRDDQDKFLAVLEERLGLSHLEIKLGRVNPSLSPEELYWYPLISRMISAAASQLGTSRFRKVYSWYVKKTLDNKLRPLIKVLSVLRPGRKVTEAEFPLDILKYFEGKAIRLKDNPLYASYAVEYLWDS